MYARQIQRPERRTECRHPLPASNGPRPRRYYARRGEFAGRFCFFGGGGLNTTDGIAPGEHNRRTQRNGEGCVIRSCGTNNSGVSTLRKLRAWYSGVLPLAKLRSNPQSGLRPRRICYCSPVPGTGAVPLNMGVPAATSFRGKRPADSTSRAPRRFL